MSTASASPTHPSLSDYGLLLALSAIWGSSFMFIKIAVESAPAISVTAARVTIGGLLLLGVAWHAGQALPRGTRTWAMIVLAALFGNTLPFTLITWGEERIDSGLAAILMAVMPLVTLVLAHFFTADERITARKTIGVLLGLAGLAILIGPSTLSGLGSDLIRQTAVAAAAVCYAINALITKHLMGLPRRALAAAIVLASAVMLIPASIVVDRPGTIEPSARSIMAVVVLGVVQTAIATLMMFALIRRQGASFFSQLNFLVPLFGVMYGALLLAERPSANAYVALAVILAGIAFARGRLPTFPRHPRA